MNTKNTALIYPDPMIEEWAYRWWKYGSLANNNLIYPDPVLEQEAYELWAYKIDGRSLEEWLDNSEMPVKDAYRMIVRRRHMRRRRQ